MIAENPTIPSAALPLKVAPGDIRPLGRPGRSEPDFLIYPGDAGPDGTYGVIELKRPSSRIITSPTKGQIQLTRSAATAVSQTKLYGHQAFADRSQRAIILGNRYLCFIIMGMSDELASLVWSGMLQRQVDGLLPNECQLIPYDVVRDRFAASVFPRFIQLVPDMGLAHDKDLNGFRDAIYRFPYFDMSDETLAFWSAIEDIALAKHGLSFGDRKLLDRQRWVIIGPDQFATESDTFYSFRGCVDMLIEALASLTSGPGNDRMVKTAKDFIEGMDCLSSFRRGELGGLGEDVIRKAIRNKKTDDIVFVSDYYKREVRDFVDHSGCFHFLWHDSGETAFLLHPYADDRLFAETERRR